MFWKSSHWKSWALGCVCVAAATGCSSNRLALQSPSSFPDQQSRSVPGSAEVAQGDELRHPATVHIAYARWQETQKQVPQARESYQRALTHDPKSVEALLGLSRLDRHAGRNSEAEAHLQHAEKLRPKDPLVWAAWGEHYAASGRWTEAISRYRQAAAQAPDEVLYRHQLAVVLARSGAIQESLTLFAGIVGPAEAHYNVGYLLQLQGKLLEAEEQYQRSLALKPDLAPASKMLAKVRAERGVPTQIAARPAAPTIETASAVAGTPSDTQPAIWQSHGQAPLPGAATFGAPAAQPPENLMPQQLEQWRNQQETLQQ